MLRSDLSQNLSLSDVATACKLSVSHFARAFKASTGAPPHQWVLAARIDMARDLLVNSPTPLVHVAGMCGFADQHNAVSSKRFRRFHGERKNPTSRFDAHLSKQRMRPALNLI